MGDLRRIKRAAKREQRVGADDVKPAEPFAPPMRMDLSALAQEKQTVTIRTERLLELYMIVQDVPHRFAVPIMGVMERMVGDIQQSTKS